MFHLQLESLEPYAGVRCDDVEQLLAIPLPELTPSKFGLTSIRKAVEMALAKVLVGLLLDYTGKGIEGNAKGGTSTLIGYHHRARLHLVYQ